MRTAETIAQQQETKDAKGENSKSYTNRSGNRRGIALRPYKWRPGQSGNPGGRPKADVSRAIAKRIFENNEEGAYAALGKALLKGNAYVFKELAERAYGKMPQKVEMSMDETISERLKAGRKRVSSGK